MLALFLMCWALVASSSPQFTLPNGAVITGLLTSPLETFLGIPFAHAPRFAAPIAALPTQNFAATSPGPVCFQYPPLPVPSSEECLNFNVYRPANITAKSKLPIVVWVYGGSYQHGAGLIYDPSALISSLLAQDGLGAIVLTFNYRMNVFGFMSHPSLPFPRSFGVQDQLLFVSLVRSLAPALGGDPNRISVWGESAGGSSTHSLVLLSPPGLIHAATMESPGPWRFPTTIAAEAFVLSSLLPLTNCTSLTCLINMPAATLFAAVQPILEDSPLLPQVGPGELLSVQPLEFLRRTNIVIPDAFMLGQNAHEGRFFVALVAPSGTMSELQFDLLVNTSLAQMTKAPTLAQVSEWYADSILMKGYWEAASEVFADLIFNCGAREALNMYAARAGKSKLYRYLFDEDTVKWQYAALGATHTAELPYIFPGLLGAQLNVSETGLSQYMMRAWMSLAKSAEMDNSLQFAEYQNGEIQMLDLERATTLDSLVFPNCKNWAPYLYY